jgi:hypothetical protein
MALSTDEMHFNALFTQIARARDGWRGDGCVESRSLERSRPAPMRPHDACDVAKSGKAMFINSKLSRAFAQLIESPLSAEAPCSVG